MTNKKNSLLVQLSWRWKLAIWRDLLHFQNYPEVSKWRTALFHLWFHFTYGKKRKCLYFLIHSLAILGFLPILVHFTVTSQESHTFAPGLCHVSKPNSYGFTSFYFSATSSRYATVTSCCIPPSPHVSTDKGIECMASIMGEGDSRNVMKYNYFHNQSSNSHRTLLAQLEMNNDTFHPSWSKRSIH